MPLLPAFGRKRKFALLLVLALAATASLQAQLNANFTADRSGGCSPLTVNFTNASSGVTSGATYLWDFGNGNTSTLANPAAIFLQEQPYTVKLTVTQNGQSSVKTMTIEVYKRPTVNFSANSVKGCIPFDVTFTAQAQAGSGNVASYFWDYGDGFTGQTASPSINHIYNNKQPATVSVTVKNNYGCATTAVKPNYIDVKPQLIVDFDASQQVLCLVTDPVQFTNKTKGPGTLTYNWDFGDGQTSTQTDPSHSFNQRGNYTVKLTANSSEGCTVTKTKTDFLNVANYTTTMTAPATICRNINVQFTGNFYPQPTLIQWEVDGNIINYNYPRFDQAFNVPGQHIIKVHATYGNCKQTATHNLTVYDLPETNGFEFKVNGVCGSPVTVDFNDTSKNIARREWNFDYYGTPGATVHATTAQATRNYPVDGNYTVHLRTYNADGCSRDVWKTVSIARPMVNVGLINTYNGPQISCQPMTFGFMAYTSETIVSYKWTIDNTITFTTPTINSHTFSTPGNHTVRLDWETDKGCKGTANYPYVITVATKPEVDFTSLSGTTICGNSLVTFQVSGTNYNNHLWSVNGQVVGYSGSNNWTYNFNDTGTYTIGLLSNLSNSIAGCSDTVTKVNYIKVTGPFPDFSGYKISCDERGKVEFTHNSRHAQSVTWDFGDGQKLTTNASQLTVAHKYAATGRYNVLLTAVNGTCSLSATQTVVVILNPQPQLTFSPAQACASGGSSFTITGLEPNPSVIFTGSYWHYVIERVEYGDGTPFNGSMSSPYMWSLPYGGSISNLDPSKSGIRMIIREMGTNCLDTTNTFPLVINGAKAGFQLLNNNICFTDSIRFQDTSSVINGTAIVEWEWIFGDGQRLVKNTGGNVAHLYASPGYYYPVLRVKNALGCIVTSMQAQVVVNGPRAAFNAPASAPFNSLVSFFNNTNDFPFYRATYRWDFGDGNTSTANSPQHTFTVPGKYTVKLTATDPVTGCTSTYSQQIDIQLVNAYFNFKNTIVGQASCPPVLTNFTVTAFNVDSLSWDFGDGTTAGDLRFASHVYEKPGKYIVTLTARGANGIIYRYLDSVIIKQPAVSLTADDWDGCPGHTINLGLTGTYARSYAWDFGDGSIVQSQAAAASHTYADPGTYTPSLLVVDSSGCTISVPLNNKVTVFPKPQITASPANGQVCLGQPIRLTAGGAQTYSWSPAAGLDNPLSAQPLASPTQTTTYRINGTDANGCTNYTDYTLTVRHPFTVQLQQQVEICDGKSAVLFASGAHHYNWINTTGGLSNTQSANPMASPSVTTTYTVVGYDEFNCFTDTATVQVIVNPKPTVNAGNDVEAQPGDEVKLSASGSSNVVSWTWSPATYLNCANCAAPVSKPQAPITYKVTGATAKGCEAFDEVQIKMQCSDARVRIPNAFTPNRDGKNDALVIKGIAIVRHMTVYNRWGNKIFERNNFVGGDESQCWDGTFNGLPQPTGTYVYVVELQCPGGEVFIKKGTVTLVR